MVDERRVLRLALRLLGIHGVLLDRLAHRMRQAAGFRDVLGHDHVQVDDRIVLDRLADPSELQEFVASVAGWLPGAR